MILPAMVLEDRHGEKSLSKEEWALEVFSLSPRWSGQKLQVISIAEGGLAVCSRNMMLNCTVRVRI